MIDKWEVIALDNTVQNLEAENTAAHARYDEVMAKNRRLNGELEELTAEVESIQDAYTVQRNRAKHWKKKALDGDWLKQQQEIERLREALRPFAEAWTEIEYPDISLNHVAPTDFEQAARALEVTE